MATPDINFKYLTLYYNKNADISDPLTRHKNEIKERVSGVFEGYNLRKQTANPEGYTYQEQIPVAHFAEILKQTHDSYGNGDSVNADTWTKIAQTVAGEDNQVNRSELERYYAYADNENGNFNSKLNKEKLSRVPNLASMEHASKLYRKNVQGEDVTISQAELDAEAARSTAIIKGETEEAAAQAASAARSAAVKEETPAEEAKPKTFAEKRQSEIDSLKAKHGYDDKQAAELVDKKLAKERAEFEKGYTETTPTGAAPQEKGKEADKKPDSTPPADSSSTSETPAKPVTITTGTFEQYRNEKLAYAQDENKPSSFAFIKKEGGKDEDDKQISKRQYRKSLSQLAESMSKSLGAGDGKQVSEANFKKMVEEEQIAFDQDPDSAKEVAKGMFYTYDQNGDGKLSKRELEAYIVDRDMDENGEADGELDYENFKTYGRLADKQRVATQYQAVTGNNIFKASKKDYQSNPLLSNGQNQYGVSQFTQNMLNQNAQMMNFGGMFPGGGFNFGSFMQPNPNLLYEAMGGTSFAGGGTLSFPGFGFNFGSPMGGGMPYASPTGSFHSISGGGYASSGGLNFGGMFPSFGCCFPSFGYGNNGFSAGANNSYTGTSGGLALATLGTNTMLGALNSYLAYRR